MFYTRLGVSIYLCLSCVRAFPGRLTLEAFPPLRERPILPYRDPRAFNVPLIFLCLDFFSGR